MFEYTVELSALHYSTGAERGSDVGFSRALRLTTNYSWSSISVRSDSSEGSDVLEEIWKFGSYPELA